MKFTVPAFIVAAQLSGLALHSDAFTPSKPTRIVDTAAIGSGSGNSGVGASSQPSLLSLSVPPRRRHVILNEKAKEDDNSNGSGAGGGFSLSNLFGGSKNEGGSESGTNTLLRGSGGRLAPHPSVKDHISPLNRLGPTPDPPSSSLRDPLPLHPDVRSGTLPNGLPYIILPNKSPPGRFEAHLQVFSGSADELEPQQGIAHLTEHVAYMGSRKRELLFGTGSQTNGK
jgi:Insulinase (Peptidase family M16)